MACLNPLLALSVRRRHCFFLPAPSYAYDPLSRYGPSFFPSRVASYSPPRPPPKPPHTHTPKHESFLQLYCFEVGPLRSVQGVAPHGKPQWNGKPFASIKDSKFSFDVTRSDAPCFKTHQYPGTLGFSRNVLWKKHTSFRELKPTETLLQFLPNCANFLFFWDFLWGPVENSPTNSQECAPVHCFIRFSAEFFQNWNKTIQDVHASTVFLAFAKEIPNCAPVFLRDKTTKSLMPLHLSKPQRKNGWAGRGFSWSGCWSQSVANFWCVWQS